MVRRVDREISQYRTRRPHKQKRTILIATEGKNKTERLYFEHFNNRNNNYVLVFAKGNTTDPVNMVKALINEMKTREINTSLGDEVFCVFDTDGIESKNKQIKESLTLAEEHGIQIIASTPCFEVWILCHYENSTAALTSKKAIKQVQYYLKKYDKNYDVYPEIKDKTENAIKNAKIKEQYHLNQSRNINLSEANPSTQVYKIITSLQKLSK